MVIIEAIKHKRMITPMETIGFILGLYGTMILSVPDLFEKWCFCWCVKKKKVQEV